jgi:hypothetical protein
MDGLDATAPPPTVVVEAPAPPRSQGSALFPRRLGARVGLGTLLGAGFGPGANMGVSVLGGVSYGRWTIDLEGRVDGPSDAIYTSGSVQTALRLAEIVPCYHKSAAFGCAVLAGGAIRREGVNDAEFTHTTTFYAMAGVRGGVEIPIVSVLAGRIGVDVLFPLTPKAIAFRDGEAWSSPPVGLALNIGALARF